MRNTFRVNNKNTRTMLVTSFWCFFLLILNIFHTFFWCFCCSRWTSNMLTEWELLLLKINQSHICQYYKLVKSFCFQWYAPRFLGRIQKTRSIKNLWIILCRLSLQHYIWFIIPCRCFLKQESGLVHYEYPDKFCFGRRSTSQLTGKLQQEF